MRIKINLMQMTPDKSPATYWLHVDLTSILVIKQLKEKIQKVLKESHDIELYLDNVPFLDGDDIHAINENEEIIVKVKYGNNCTVSNAINAETNGSNGSVIPNGTLSYTNLNLLPVLCNGIPTEPSTPKKRVRKRTHKKNKQQVKPLDVENNLIDFQSDTSIVPIKGTSETSRIHKRFKLLDNENNHDAVSESSNDSLQVTREVFYNEPSPLKPKITKTTFQTKGSTFKSPNVPVFVRGKICTPENSIANSTHSENYNDKSITSSDEDCDTSVVDWKNMCPVKLSNILELQINDLLQFKTLSMNECGEPEMSPVITARVNGVSHEFASLTIQILSGINAFLKLQTMCDDNDEETDFVVQFGDMFEVCKLL